MISVGIDIGGSSVKLAEVQAGSKTYSIQRFQEFPLSNDLNKDKKIEILDILRQIAAAYDPNTTRFVLAVEQQHVAIRYRQFPFKERFKILRSIAFELEDDIPFSQDDAIFDAKITRFVDNSAEVMAVACPKLFLKDLVQLAREAGIEPDVVTIEGFALSNTAEDWISPPAQQIGLAPTPEARSAEVILDIGHHRSVLITMCEGALISARNIDWGGRQIAEFIAQKYGLHYLEALKEMQKKAFILLSNEGATRDQIAFSDTIKQALEPLAQEVKFSILEVATSRNVKVTTAQLCGGTSQIKNLGPYLTQKWEVPTNRFQHFQRYPVNNLEPTMAIEATSATAIGVAIEGLRRPRNPAINLLKGEFAQQGESLKVFWDRWGHASKLLIASFFALLIYGALRDTFALSLSERTEEVLKAKAKEVANLAGREATPSRIRNFVKTKKAEISSRKMAAEVKKINSALDVLNKIHQNAAPSRQMVVEIRRFIVNNDEIQVHGEVPDAAAIGTFRKTLESVAFGGQVTPVTSLATPGAGKTVFGFSFKVDRRGGG